jgi:hypothetical protein
MALVQGAEGIDMDEDWYEPQAAVGAQAMRMHDMPGIAASGLSLGYETTSQ